MSKQERIKQKVSAGVNLAIIGSFLLTACNAEAKNPTIKVDSTQTKPEEAQVIPELTLEAMRTLNPEVKQVEPIIRFTNDELPQTFLNGLQDYCKSVPIWKSKESGEFEFDVFLFNKKDDSYQESAILVSVEGLTYQLLRTAKASEDPNEILSDAQVKPLLFTTNSENQLTYFTQTINQNGKVENQVLMEGVSKNGELFTLAHLLDGSTVESEVDLVDLNQKFNYKIAALKAPIDYLKGEINFNLQTGEITTTNIKGDMVAWDGESQEWVEVVSPLNTKVPEWAKDYIHANKMEHIEIDGGYYLNRVGFFKLYPEAPKEYGYSFKWNGELNEWEVFVPESVPIFYELGMDLNKMYEIAEDPVMQAKQLEILSSRYAKYMSIDQLIPMEMGDQDIILRYSDNPSSDGFVGEDGGGFYFLQIQQDYVDSTKAILMPLKIEGLEVKDSFVGIFPMLLGDKEMMPIFVQYPDGKMKTQDQYERDFFTAVDEDILSMSDKLANNVIVYTMRLYFNTNASDYKQTPTIKVISQLNKKYPDWQEVVIYAMNSYGSNEAKDEQVRELLSHGLFGAYYMASYKDKPIILWQD